MSSICTTRSTWELRKTRPPTEELFSFVDEFMDAVAGKCFPKCCVHFEDWTGKGRLSHLLERYRDKLLCLQRRRARHGGDHSRWNDQRDEAEGHKAEG